MSPPRFRLKAFWGAGGKEKMYKVKGKNETYETPFDLMKKEDIVTENGINNFGTDNGDISFYDFIKSANEILCKNCKENGSSNSAQNASSEDSAQNASSGDYAQNASSGYSAQNASSGDYAQNASSGDYTKNASSGYRAKNASSGDRAKNASSGYSAQNASSGDYAQNASSGDSAQNASSGDYAQNASSGDYTKNAITGKNSVDVSCGYKTITKGVKGTWFALTDYEEQNGDFIPVLVKAGQIGVSLDWEGETLKENQYYMLIRGEFTPICVVDGDYMIPVSERNFNGYKIMHCFYENEYRDKKEDTTNVYVAEKDGIFAHGETIKKAIADVQYKYLLSLDVSEHVARIKKSGIMTAMDYRLLTGACEFGTNRFLKAYGYTWEDTASINKVIEVTKGQYGHERLEELLK